MYYLDHAKQPHLQLEVRKMAANRSSMIPGRKCGGLIHGLYFATDFSLPIKQKLMELG